MKSERVQWPFAFLAGVLLLLWPTLINRAPFLFVDTTAYIRAADAAVVVATGARTSWSNELEARRSSSPAAPTAHGKPSAAEGLEDQPVVLAGRSIYYGALLYLSHLAGSFWFLATFQAMLVVIASTLTFASILGLSGRSIRPGALILILAALAVGSPVAVFAGFMMPDIFAGLAILAVANLVAFDGRLNALARLFWFTLLVAAQLFHSSIIAIVAGLCLTTGGAAVFFRARVPVRLLLRIAATVAVALAGEAAFSASVKAATGNSPVRPPFVTARLVADGPGLAYLRENCPQAPFYLCKFMPVMPTHSDGFLWVTKRPGGIFSTVTEREKRLLAAEQGSFIAAVLADRPLEVIKSSTRSMVDQIQQFGLIEFDYAASGQAAAFDRKLPPELAQSTKQTMAYPGSMPLRVMEILMAIGLFMATITVVAAFTRMPNEARIFGVLVFVGVAANAAVCGMLSTPHERYQMRVVWLIPLFATLALPHLPSRHFRAF